MVTNNESRRSLASTLIICFQERQNKSYPVQESDLARIWPTRYGYVNMYGRYPFNVEEAQRRIGRRPLRPADRLMPQRPKLFYSYRKALKER